MGAQRFIDISVDVLRNLPDRSTEKHEISQSSFILEKCRAGVNTDTARISFIHIPKINQIEQIAPYPIIGFLTDVIFSWRPTTSTLRPERTL